MSALELSPNATTPRFYIDHGMVHDRVTGKHVTTDEDSVFCDGRKACCALLNELTGENDRLRAARTIEERVKHWWPGYWEGLFQGLLIGAAFGGCIMLRVFLK